jgi:hypothetical protein
LPRDAQSFHHAHLFDVIEAALREHYLADE